MDKEQRYGLKLKVATALHEHRVNPSDHRETDEWWCCVEAAMRIFEEFTDEDRNPIHAVPVDPFDDDDLIRGLVNRSRFGYSPTGIKPRNPFGPLGDLDDDQATNSHMIIIPGSHVNTTATQAVVGEVLDVVGSGMTVDLDGSDAELAGAEASRAQAHP